MLMRSIEAGVQLATGLVLSQNDPQHAVRSGVQRIEVHGGAATQTSPRPHSLPGRHSPSPHVTPSPTKAPAVPAATHRLVA
jgi:hypothetical protein